MGSASSTSSIVNSARALPKGLSRAEFASAVGVPIYMAKYYGRKVAYEFRDTRPERSGQVNRRGPETDSILRAMAGRGETLKDTGRRLGGVTRERARQLYAARGIDRSGVSAARAEAKQAQRARLAEQLRHLLGGPEAWKLTWSEAASALGVTGRKAGDLLAALAGEFGVVKPTLADAQREKLKVGQAWCQTCQAWKPVEKFYRCSRRPNGLQAKCKPCLKAALGRL